MLNLLATCEISTNNFKLYYLNKTTKTQIQNSIHTKKHIDHSDPFQVYTRQIIASEETGSSQSPQCVILHLSLWQANQKHNKRSLMVCTVT